MTLVKFHPFLLFDREGDFLSPTSYIVQPKETGSSLLATACFFSFLLTMQENYVVVDYNLNGKGKGVIVKIDFHEPPCWRFSKVAFIASSISLYPVQRQIFDSNHSLITVSFAFGCF